MVASQPHGICSHSRQEVSAVRRLEARIDPPLYSNWVLCRCIVATFVQCVGAEEDLLGINVVVRSSL